jgi:hypothetical protein
MPATIFSTYPFSRDQHPTFALNYFAEEKREEFSESLEIHQASTSLSVFSLILLWKFWFPDLC